MYALTSFFCTLVMATSPVIEDAPSRYETIHLPSAQPEEMNEPISASLSKEIAEPPKVEMASEVTLSLQEIEIATSFEEQAPPLVENAIQVQETEMLPGSVIMIGSTPESPRSFIEVKPAQTIVAKTVEVEEAPPAVVKGASISLKEVFSGAPLIYSMLFLMSFAALTIWLYHLLLIRKEKLMPQSFAAAIEGRLAVGNWQEALALCQKDGGLLATLVRASISARHEGSQAMLERMQNEGKRATSFFWQRLSLLNDIALIAPMIGLLGTVLGMFYAFYDVNRSIESMYTLFDGLGISVGTTVGGLLVAIMALCFHSTLKYRLVHQLAAVEAKAQQISLHPSTQYANASSNLQTRETHELGT